MAGTSDGRRLGIRVPWRAAVLAPVLLPLVVVIPTATAAMPPRLAATTVFTATTNATITVNIPRTATLTLTKDATSSSVDVSAARGRLAGFTFTAVQRTTAEPPTLVAMYAGKCWQPGCRATAPYKAREYVTAFPGLHRTTVDGSTEQVTLPAGDYVVRAITDGAPVQMTMRLAGLSGRTSIRAAHRFGAVLRTDASTDGVMGINPLRNVGVSHDFASDLGLMMDMVFLNYDPHVRSESGYCLYRGDAAPPTGYYHPECPGAEYGHWVDFGQPTTQYRGSEVGADIALLPGKWTRGYYATGVGGASSLTVVTLWFDLT